jgi:hypothetical protein
VSNHERYRNSTDRDRTGATEARQIERERPQVSGAF